VARRWRLNPPPNWPALPDGWEPAPDWTPDPEWGPAPVGWTLWRRERRGAWLLRHRRTAGVGTAAALTLFVTLAGPPSSGTLAGGAPEPAALAAPPPLGGALVVPQTPPDRPQAEPAVRMERRASPSREHHPASRTRQKLVAAPLPTETRERRRTVQRDPHRTPAGGGTQTCEAAAPTSEPAPSPSPTPAGSRQPTPTGTATLHHWPDHGPGDRDVDAECLPGGPRAGPGPTGSRSPDPSG
jgi:hypothetical protein